jgi:inner membrane protein
MVLGAMGFGWLLTRLSATRPLSFYQAGIGAFFIFSTHVLIDLFNVYGTQLLAPVWRKGFALDNMFIIDPLFTIPLLIGTVGAYFLKKQTFAPRLNLSCLLLASLYVAWSFSAQSIAKQKFHLALTEQNNAVSRQITSAGSFTTFLWRHIAETPDGFFLAYWSFFDDTSKPIRFHFIPRNDTIIKQVKNARTFKTIDWFSQGWWFVAESDGKSARVVDLRFGEIPSATGQKAYQWDWPFAWKMYLTEKDETELKALRPALKDPLTSFRILFKRILGQGEWLSTT